VHCDSIALRRFGSGGGGVRKQLCFVGSPWNNWQAIICFVWDHLCECLLRRALPIITVSIEQEVELRTRNEGSDQPAELPVQADAERG
jgi:hypothetical protein